MRDWFLCVSPDQGLLAQSSRRAHRSWEPRLQLLQTSPEPGFRFTLGTRPLFARELLTDIKTSVALSACDTNRHKRILNLSK